MKKIFLMLIAAVFVMAGPVHAGKLTVGSTNNGQFTDLKITGADATYTKTSGNEATINLNYLAQPSTSAAIPVITLTQSDTDESFINFAGTSATSGQSTSVVTYASAQSQTGLQAGAVAIKVNGTRYWLHFFAS